VLSVNAKGMKGAHCVLGVCIDDVNWNPMDWDRAAEELTWERV